MIRLIIFLLLLGTPSILHADDAASPNEQETRPIDQPEENKAQQSTTWPYPFTPSQDVGADSQVAFPTDI